jgi:hypothetical protein
MRAAFVTWEREELDTLKRIDTALQTIVRNLGAVVTSSNRLPLKRTSANTDSLSQRRSRLRRLVVLRSLRDINCLFVGGPKFLGTKLKDSGSFDSTELVKIITTDLPDGAAPPTVSAPAVYTTPPQTCRDSSAELFDDQLTVSTAISETDRQILVTTVFELDTTGPQWIFKLARRGIVCPDSSMSNFEKRSIDKRINSYLMDHTTNTLNSPFDLPARKQVAVTSRGETIQGALICLLKITTSVAGYQPHSYASLSPYNYALPTDTDAAIVLGVGACEALMASAVVDYEQDPNNWGFFHEDYFPKWLSKDITLQVQPATNSFSCNLGFSAKKQGTTLGKDWDCDVGGYIPLRCSFTTIYDVTKINVNLVIAQTAKLQVQSHKFNAGLIGDVIDGATHVVDDAIRDAVNQMKWISATVPFQTFQGATRARPRVTSDGLIMELSY